MSPLKTAMAFGIAGILLAGCSSPTPTTTSQTTDGTEVPVDATGDSATGVAPVTVEVLAQNNSGQTGTATFEDVNGTQTRVTLTLTGGTFTEAQPAHIHTGTCAKPGAVTYPLTNVVDGMSVTTIDAAMGTLWAGDQIVNVHKSAAQSTVYTACGVLAAPAVDAAPVTDEPVAPAVQY
jgi:hypothetical protein